MGNDGHRDDTEQRYQRIAPLYDVLDGPFEWLRYRPLRRLLCGSASGRVFEAGVGTGRNLPFYPASAQVTGMDLSPAMLARARQRHASASVELVTGDVTATGLASADFDTVVASFTLCVLPVAQRPDALREMARLCRPDAEIRLLEYRRSQRPLRRSIMRLWEPWVRWAFGADFDLDIDAAAKEAGLRIEDSRAVVSDIIHLVRLAPNG
jgi:ubiquinone/menaquinone biosynthesis C-methylase UbiE